MNRRHLVACLALLGLGSSSLLFAGPSRPAIGLAAKGAQRFFEQGLGPLVPEANDRFANALAVGDFNHDGYDDLAIGVPLDDHSASLPNAGSVQVRFGGPEGAGVATRALQGVIPLVPWDNAVDPSEPHDQYGRALAAGDFDGDGHDDLAVGIPGNKLIDGGDVFSSGGVQLHYGLPDALGSIQTVAEFSFAQVRGGRLPGNPGHDERFGEAVAFGDFNGDGKDDLAVGIPNDFGFCGAANCRSGSVMVIGQDDGGAFGGFLMRYGVEGLPGVPADQNYFGKALATGDFNGDGFADLAIGIPGDNSDRGSVLIVYGSVFSLIFANHQLFDQGSFGELPEDEDDFGYALAAGDFNGDGFDDLAMAAPFESVLEIRNAGQVIVSSGSPAGLSTLAAPWLSETGMFGSGSEQDDLFGSSLAAGDFDGDGVDDLAIGHRLEDFAGVFDSGAVTVIRGRTAGLAGSTIRQLLPGMFPTGLIPGGGHALAKYGSALACGDFDGNGFADLAIGAPDMSLPGMDNVGAVAVVYGQLFVDGFESQDAFEWSASTP